MDDNEAIPMASPNEAYEQGPQDTDQLIPKEETDKNDSDKKEEETNKDDKNDTDKNQADGNEADNDEAKKDDDDNNDADDEAENDDTDLNDVKNKLHCLYQRYKENKRYCAKSSEIFSTLELFIFSIPLLVIQLFAAVIPSMMEDDELSHTLSTSLAAATAAMITTDMRLGWGKKSEAFKNAASGYTTLLEKAAHHCILNSGDLDELKAFLKDCERTESYILRNCPPVPEWVEKKIMTSEHRRSGNDVFHHPEEMWKQPRNLLQ